MRAPPSGSPPRRGSRRPNGPSYLKNGAKGFTKEGLKAGLKYAGEKAVKKLAGRAAGDAFDLVRGDVSDGLQSMAKGNDARLDPAKEAQASWRRGIDWNQDHASNAMLVVK